jgi:tetratricopeptide (TPR) repeat protein
MYLPSVGVFSALTVAIFMVINRWKAYVRVTTVMLVAIIIVMTGATYARNLVWKDEMSLWQDVVNKNPNNGMALNNLGNCYYLKGDIIKAREYYLKSIQSDPNYRPPYNNMVKTDKILGLKSDEKLFSK